MPITIKLRQLILRRLRAYCDHIMQQSKSFPSPLTNLMQEPKYSELKDLFIARRKAFKATPNASIDLEAYERGDNLHDYTVLKGLVPPSLIGKPDVGGGIPYGKSDAFFTDFERHHPNNDILSQTDDSFIIGNRASHDVRLYSSECDPGGQDRSATAGMAYSHLLVIPRGKVYNAVALESTKIIEEMITHFEKFWAVPGSIQKAIDRATRATDVRVQEVLDGFKKNPDTEAVRLKNFQEVLSSVQRSSVAFAEESRKLSPTDFFFGFHAAPDASVGHLHMHVLPMPGDFRRYSTGEHDWKTVPATIVMEVIHEEKVVNK